MESMAKDFIAILQYLLPGFLAAWVFYAFTSFSKPSQFERVVQALIFSLMIQALVFLEKFIVCLNNQSLPWTQRLDIVCSTITAIILGAVFSYYSNNDKFHHLARRLKLTNKTSFPSEWFGAFSRNVTYVVLHLNDERRIYGWVKEWPSDPDHGHIELVQPSWLVVTKTGDRREQTEIPMAGVDSVLIDVKNVTMVEFMEKTWEKKDEQENIQSSAAAAKA